MVAQTLHFVPVNLQRTSAKRLYGMAAPHALMQFLRTDVTDEFTAHLQYVALPVGVRHTLDARYMQGEGGRAEEASLVAEQSRLLGG